MAFLESARQGGSEKASLAMYLVKKKLTILNAQKKIAAPLAPEFIITDSGSCQLSPLPETPPPSFGGSIAPPPPPRFGGSIPPPPPPPCDFPSGCCFFTGPWTVTRFSLRMLRRVAVFCRPLRPVLLLVSFPLSWSPVVGVPGLCWMWHGVPFTRQRRPVVGVLRLCWLLSGSGSGTVFAVHTPLSTGRP